MEIIKLTDQNTRHILNRNNKKGFELLSAKKYQQAYEFFAKNLALDSDNTESMIGILLADMATDFEEQALGLYEYYQILLTQEISKRQAQKQMLETIKSFDKSTTKIFDTIKTIEALKADSINGILYEDFKRIAQTKESFKEAFEDLIFSTKIVFTNKSDFYEFLNYLVDNNYEDISMDYIESLKKNVFYDKEIEQILQKVIDDSTKKHKL
ncbi:hypothetical protein LS68_004120 [Helicobacter sp. MIT 05-5293]|uniref:Histidine kinase n=1 Tax=uncultured Helicobacter sp. TaxID=175537 RepID=A0A650EKV6_9HELI|nr:hypothetical protein [Helicobacter sp. MIT 05-5293]QGT50390.1 hypothetical protein Helico5904_0620 [uncultured Helicobacter sp.]TLD82186.1 hypothetical protein LS68_004120 [Helicobacter sp. MIT 05-5293]